MSERLLLPYRWRLFGYGLLIPGAALAVARFWFRWVPEELEIGVFAIASQYLEQSLFQFVENNVIEEIVGFLIVAGLFLSVLTREPEGAPDPWEVRSRAMIVAVWSHAIALLVAVVFTFGLAFIQALFVVLLVFPVSFRIAHAMFMRQYGAPGTLPTS